MVNPIDGFPKEPQVFSFSSSFKKGDFPKSEHILLSQLKPLILALRVFFCMPLTWRSQDNRTKWRTWWLVYSVTGYTILTIIVSFIFVAKLKLTSRDMPFGDMPYHYGSILFMLFHAVPFFCNVEIRKISKLFNTWNSAEMKYVLITGHTPKIYLKTQMYCVVAFATVSTISLAVYLQVISKAYYEHRELKSSLKAMELPMIVYQQALVNLTGNLYLMLNISIQQFATVIADDLKNIHRMSIKTIRRYSALWVELRDVANLLGEAFTYSGVAFMLCQFCINVASFYNFAINILHGRELGSHFLISVLCLSLQVMVPEGTHHTIDKVGPQFQALLARSRTLVEWDSDIGKCVKEFHELVAYNPVNISLGGFITLNRGLTVSILGSYVTYVVIFLQMQPSSSCSSDLTSTTTTFYA